MPNAEASLVNEALKHDGSFTPTLYTAWNASLNAPWPNLDISKSDRQSRSGLQNMSSIGSLSLERTWGPPIIPPDWMTSHIICTVEDALNIPPTTFGLCGKYHPAPNFGGRETRRSLTKVFARNRPSVMWSTQCPRENETKEPGQNHVPRAKAGEKAKHWGVVSTVGPTFTPKTLRGIPCEHIQCCICFLETIARFRYLAPGILRNQGFGHTLPRPDEQHPISLLGQVQGGPRTLGQEFLGSCEPGCIGSAQSGENKEDKRSECVGTEKVSLTHSKSQLFRELPTTLLLANTAAVSQLEGSQRSGG